MAKDGNKRRETTQVVIYIFEILSTAPAENGLGIM